MPLRGGFFNAPGRPARRTSGRGAGASRWRPCRQVPPGFEPGGTGALPWSKVRLLARFVGPEDEGQWIAWARRSTSSGSARRRGRRGSRESEPRRGRCSRWSRPRRSRRCRAQPARVSRRKPSPAKQRPGDLRTGRSRRQQQTCAYPTRSSWRHLTRSSIAPPPLPAFLRPGERQTCAQVLRQEQQSQLFHRVSLVHARRTTRSVAPCRRKRALFLRQGFPI